MNIVSLKRLEQRTINLAVSYLAIIMILCVGFSLIFYQLSTKGLSLSLQVNSGPPATQGADTQGPALQADGGPSNVSLSGNASEGISQLNAQLQRQLQTVREALAYRLLLFNFGALIVGACISYYLARRTLRPIEAAMELQARFSSDASHELRTPLAALRARSEVALHDSRLTLVEARQVIKDDIEQAHKLEELAECLLQLSRDDTVASRETVSLQEIANEAMNAVIPLAQSRHIATEEHVPHVRVKADRQGLVRVIIILLDNAIKYSPKRSTIYLDGVVGAKYATLRVRDEGIGIDAKDLPHIFERFYRADTSRSKQGYGLGLSIAHKIITKLGGTITVESTTGVGSVFTVKLPLARL